MGTSTSIVVARSEDGVRRIEWTPATGTFASVRFGSRVASFTIRSASTLSEAEDVARGLLDGLERADRRARWDAWKDRV